jgi:hypothetical protein
MIYHPARYLAPTWVKIQAPDITEAATYSFAYGGPGEMERDGQDKRDNLLLERIGTQFLWAVEAPYCTNQEVMKLMGLKPIRAMSNRFWSHLGEKRKLTLWWKKLREEQPLGPSNVKRVEWGGSSKEEKHPDLTLGWSGCGFAFAQPPFDHKFRSVFGAYFTLVRIPIEDHNEKVYESLLHRCNFSLIDVGSMSAFYANGWAPDEYSYPKEETFFKEHKGIVESLKVSRDEVTVKFHDLKIKRPYKSRATKKAPTDGDRQLSSPSIPKLPVEVL